MIDYLMIMVDIVLRVCNCNVCVCDALQQIVGYNACISLRYSHGAHHPSTTVSLSTANDAATSTAAGRPTAGAQPVTLVMWTRSSTTSPTSSAGQRRTTASSMFTVHIISRPSLQTTGPSPRRPCRRPELRVWAAAAVEEDIDDEERRSPATNYWSWRRSSTARSTCH